MDTPFSNIARRLYPGGQGSEADAQAPAPQSNGSASANGAGADTGDRFARLFEILEKNPDNAYNKDFDKRHPELNRLTPELRPFAREVMMRQELKGWKPKALKTIRTEEEERGHMADGTSAVSDPKDSRHIDLGNGADAADVADERYGWGVEKNKQKTPEDHFRDQRAKDYFKDQQQSFEETKKRWGSEADRFKWGGYWSQPWDPAHIENSQRVVPKDDDEDEAN